MQYEVWLRTNRRVLVASATLPLVLLVGALGALPFAAGRVLFWSLVIFAALSACVLAWLVRRARRPRLAYREGHLAVYLTRGEPLLVPIEIVECFFMGQGPSLLPTPPTAQNDLETSTLIVRLAEAAQEWKHRDVQPWLGQWCEGYITIRGTFCEPLNRDVAARLNRRLVEVHRARRQAQSDVQTQKV